jgi:gliding motility-associated-like protein
MANGSFTDPVVTFGSSTQPVPFGTYIVKITDVCGRTTTESIVIEFIKPTPSVLPINNGCFSVFGKIRISVPPQEIVTAKITAASPVTYTASLPQDVSGNINTAGTLVLNDMPVGFYTIVIKDNCGFEYEIKDIEVPEFKEKAFNIVALPACNAGFGTVRARSGNGALTHVEITSGPGITAAQDVSANIIDGFFFMDGLPAGHYVFTATDICGIVKPLEIDVEGYNPELVSYSYTPNCGNFSVLVTDDSNGIEGSVYWLQKFNPVTGMWGHPNTGVAYIAGTVPSAQNGAKLSNGVPRNNLAFSGTFRVIKVFETFGSGTAETTVCISVIGSTFTFTEEFSINGAYSLACNGDPNDVILDISGQPSSIRITEKDGQSFVVDNGTNNIFQNLQPASYTFEIENACGDILERTFDILTLPGFAQPTQPNDMIECAPPGTMQTYEFHLTDQNEAVLNGLFSSMYTITYHTSQADADTGDNPLPEYYNATGGETIYVRLVHNEISICYGTTSFRVFIGEMQEPVILTQGTICNDGQLTLTSEAQYTNYFWSTGETTRSITVTEPGIYTLTVQKEYGNVTCPGIKTIEIKESSTPEITKIETEDWTDDQNMITVSVQGIGEYEYSINGTDYQDSNIFTGLEPGVYIVFVKDKGGCGTDAQEVVLLSYPKFFTPNGDGINETWRIKYAVKEPGMKVVIFDRYGKIITSFGANSEGWDGTYNGTRLPATDYWFVVTRQDGREFKGHFSMLR